MWACLAKAADGLNLRPAFCSDVMSFCAMRCGSRYEVADDGAS
jgi:hypothetical protein